LEQTLIIVKPDGVQRGLVGEVLARFERRGLKLAGLRLMQIDRALAERHYAVHQGKPFYDGLVNYITSGPVVVAKVTGEDAIARLRTLMGATDPAKAADGTIRKIHAKSIGENSVHGSDAPETAAVEIAQFFSGNEIVG
jgi:nucleoside-diphosphate kinase